MITPVLWIAIINGALLLAIIAILFRGKMPVSRWTVQQRLFHLKRFGAAILILGSISFGVLALFDSVGLALRFTSGAYVIPLIILMIVRFRLLQIQNRQDLPN